MIGLMSITPLTSVDIASPRLYSAKVFQGPVFFTFQVRIFEEGSSINYAA